MYKRQGIFSYSKGTYTQEKYDADLKEDEADRTNDASIRIKTVNTWITVLTDYTVDENGVAWNENQKAKLAEKADKAGKTFETAYSYWDIAVKAYTDGTKATPTQPIADLKKVTDDYNKAYTALNKAITDYNAAYDKVYKAAYDKKISELKDAKTLELYVAAFSSCLLYTSHSERVSHVIAFVRKDFIAGYRRERRLPHFLQTGRGLLVAAVYRRTDAL